MLLYMCVLSPFRREPFLKLISLGQGAILDHLKCSTSINAFYCLSSAQNSIIQFKTPIVIKFNFQSISFV
jgi:hypothetical protein